MKTVCISRENIDVIPLSEGKIWLQPACNLLTDPAADRHLVSKRHRRGSTQEFQIYAVKRPITAVLVSGFKWYAEFYGAVKISKSEQSRGEAVIFDSDCVII
ncbi:MAG: hypothetical protein CMJ74_00380 [Planctomycetaceae bacterium]|nr:hypothetical protein [Planctomycetaceae bacterium]|tara:strand:+ start:256 stop:561 length:306 start_codon:yes stop_codon:yes gene_type:complete